MSTDPGPKKVHTNRLIGETSPYLRQHAHNPVDWYPWGEEAFERAQREEKPIFLSIGYSACHWCHVMAHESFEDEAAARLLNDLFISIKVDREERPDIDRIYQIAQQVLTQRGGGWPLSMFLTHDDRRPFFGGTYFPKEARYGLPAFKDVLQRVADYYRENSNELHKQSEALIGAFAQLAPAPAPSDVRLTDEPLAACHAALERAFDPKNGGFGKAPKFPHPKLIELLLRRAQATRHTAKPDAHAVVMAWLTLQQMAAGGMNDQLGGGFYRYSVDERWMIPHFEKMLYDNGGLLAVYADAAVATGEAFLARTAELTADWALREMQAPLGGFCCSLDADSEGHEGKFYVWDRDEARAALTPEEYATFAPLYGLDVPANFEGRWHLHVAQRNQLARLDEPLIGSSRAKLMAIRDRRVRPGLDDKILTSWNALMIRGLAIAARVLRRAELAQQATQALDFLRSTLWRNGRLLATYRDGRAHLNAYLDDHVYLADAILELQQVRFRRDELAFACELMDIVLERFEDPRSGGFFFTSSDHEALIHRSKSFSDEAIPSGNGIAAFVLQRLGHLLGDTRYLAAAERTLRAAWPVLQRYPQEHASLLIALDELLLPPQIVILRGEAAEIESWRSELSMRYGPKRLVLAIPADTSDLPDALAEKAARGKAVAYICRGSTCDVPIESLSDLLLTLVGPEDDPEY
jgi:uncharacterized protein YyaL (SSP411 family)